MDNINEIQAHMKTIQLTQNQVDKIYINIKNYVKNQTGVIWLSHLTKEQEEEFELELKIIKMFSEL